MITLQYIPTGLEEIIKYYGNPDPQNDGNFDPTFWNKYMVRTTLPYPLRIGWRPEDEVGVPQTVTRIWTHRLVSNALVDALEEIGGYMSGSWEYLRRNDLDLYWGCHAFRFQRTANVYSTHSWGIAIDINKHRGELGEEPTMPEFIVEAFVKRGFVWGGEWEIKDGMHFQACEGY